MARTLTVGMQSAAVAAEVRTVYFLELVVAAGTLRLWTGVGTITWNSFQWFGGGRLLSLSDVQETAELRAVSLEARLGGFSASDAATALGSLRSGAPCRAWLGVVNQALQVTADPVKLNDLRMDTANIEEEGETSAITVRFESRLVDLDRPRERRYTDADQQAEYPGDLAFEYVASLVEKVIPLREERWIP